MIPSSIHRIYHVPLVWLEGKVSPCSSSRPGATHVGQNVLRLRSSYPSFQSDGMHATMPTFSCICLLKKKRTTFIEKSPRLPHIERVFNSALILFQQYTSVKIINQECKLCPGSIVITDFVEWVRFFPLHFNALCSHSFHIEEITKPLLG